MKATFPILQHFGGIEVIVFVRKAKLLKIYV
jgi:hypothetical protein